MGSGQSYNQSYNIDRQEQFVDKYYKKFKKIVNSPNDYFPEYKYSDSQVRAKLRQLYMNIDELPENRDSYVNNERWEMAKRELKFNKQF